MRRRFWVYILASRSRVLYVGVTGNLDRRIEEHKSGRSRFASRYQAKELVYFEVFEWVWEAIESRFLHSGPGSARPSGRNDKESKGAWPATSWAARAPTGTEPRSPTTSHRQVAADHGARPRRAEGSRPENVEDRARFATL